MTYTDTPPDRPGFYWTKSHGDSREWVAEVEEVVVDRLPELFVSFEADVVAVADYPAAVWAGPLAPPAADEWASP